MCLLQLAGVPWRVDFAADVRKAPMKKLPVLLDGDHVIADSSLIMAHLETVHGGNFHGTLSMRERAEAHAFLRMAENHIVFALTHNRWMIEANWVHLREQFFGMIPAPMRRVVANRVRRNVQKGLIGHGLGRFDEAGITERVAHDLSAIKCRLAGDFLFGEQPVAADCFIGSTLSSLASLPETTLLREHVRSDPDLMGYVGRFRDRFYPSLNAGVKVAA